MLNIAAADAGRIRARYTLLIISAIIGYYTTVFRTAIEKM